MEVAERSGVLDFLAKMCAGKPIAMRGPTGKRGLWHYQTIEDRKWAADKLLPRILPSLAVQQIGGETDGNPISFLDQPTNEFEMTRRIRNLSDDQLNSIIVRAERVLDELEGRDGSCNEIAPPIAGKEMRR